MFPETVAPSGHQMTGHAPANRSLDVFALRAAANKCILIAGAGRVACGRVAEEWRKSIVWQSGGRVA